MEFIELDSPQEYEKFVSTHPKAHFMQSYYWGDVMKFKHFHPHYMVLKDNGIIVASALMLQKYLFKGYCYYYIPRGFVLDYNNFSLIEKFTACIKVYAKEHKGIFIKIDPDIKLHNLDIDGNIIGEENQFPLIQKLQQLGYQHLGFYKSFDGEQPRYTFRLNLNRDFDSIYGGMHPTTRKILNKKNQYDLNLYKGGIEDINDFYQTMLETAERERIKAQPIEYYKNFYSILHQHGMSDLYIVKANIKNLKKSFKKVICDIEKEIDFLQNTEYKNVDKKVNKQKDLEKKLEKSKLELEEIENIKEEEITLSSIIITKYGDKVWTIHGGNSTLLRKLNSNYLLYYNIIEDAYNDGYKVIDFFGTSGEANPEKSNPIYGIHNFKKRLGGEYTEFIGEFDLVLNSFMYFLYKKLIPLYRKIK